MPTSPLLSSFLAMPSLTRSTTAIALGLLALVCLINVASGQTGVWKDYCWINVRCSQVSCRAIFPFNKCTGDSCNNGYHIIKYDPTTTRITDSYYGLDSKCGKVVSSTSYYISACYNSGSSWMYKLYG
jgi:hypothetical protein